MRDIPVEFPETIASHDVLAPLWARAQIDDLMSQDFNGAQSGAAQELKDTITQLGIEYRLMTQFTSFVAVEEMIVTDGGKPRRIDVPVEAPEGVKKEIDPASPINMPMSITFNAGRSRISGQVASKTRGSGGGGRSGGVYPLPSNSAPVVSSVDASAAGVIGSVQRILPDPQSAELQKKLHRLVLAVVEKLQKKETLSSTDEAGFIRDGKAEVQVWVTDKSNEILAQLKELGFEVVLDAKNSKVIIGRVAVEKLEALASLKSVKYVSPQVTK